MKNVKQYAIDGGIRVEQTIPEIHIEGMAPTFEAVVRKRSIKITPHLPPSPYTPRTLTLLSNSMCNFRELVEEIQKSL
jgi:hypothetical protein